MSLNIKELIQKTNKDELDKKYLLKIFLKTVFRGVDYTKEDIRILDVKKEYSKPYFYNDIDNIVDRTFSNKHCWNNQYFQLQTVSKGCNKGTTDVREYAYCIAFDFDNHAKELEQRGKITVKDIVNRFIANKIFCHCIVDTGNGYHAYIMINKTADFDKVQSVHKALCNRLGADVNAIKSTQVLRIPYSFNCKDYPKEVKIVHLEPYNSTMFRAYDIDFLYKMNVEKPLEEVRTQENIDDTTSKYVLNSCNIPYCIADKIENGSKEGDRYFDLCNIVVSLRGCNKSLSQIKEVVKDWSLKSNYNEGLSKVESIYENKQHLELSCSNCKNKSNCFNVVVSDFNYEENEQIITVSEKAMCKLKKSNRKGAKVMKSNDLLVYGILKNHIDGLTIDELTRELTYTKNKEVLNVALSDKTLRNALKSLIENDFIEVVTGNRKKGIKDLYKIKKERCKVELTYDISFSALYECIKGFISTEELRLYLYIRYLHHKAIREKTTKYKGNLFQVNQVILAEELGVTQGRISVMINNLLDEKLLSIWYRQKSKNNNFEYNIYRLNY